MHNCKFVGTMKKIELIPSYPSLINMFIGKRLKYAIKHRRNRLSFRLKVKGNRNQIEVPLATYAMLNEMFPIYGIGCRRPKYCVQIR